MRHCLVEVLEGKHRRAGLLVHDAFEVDRLRGGGSLEVAQHEHPEAVSEVGVLGQHDLLDGDGLRLAAGEHPVDRTASATDAAVGELVPHRGQHPLGSAR